MSFQNKINPWLNVLQETADKMLSWDSELGCIVKGVDMGKKTILNLSS